MKYIVRQVMLLAAIVLLLLLLYPIKWLFYPVAMFIILLSIFLMVVLVEAKMGKKCPVCGRRKLEQVLGPGKIRSNPPPYAFYRCLHCQTRVKTRYKAGWQDASDARFDHLYRGRKAEYCFVGNQIQITYHGTQEGEPLP